MQRGCDCLTVMGDVSVEIQGILAETRFHELTVDRLVYTSLHTNVGGSALNLALEATKYFRHVNLLGAVGEDPNGVFVRETLAARHVTLCGGVVPGAHTSIAVYLREEAQRAVDGLRLLVIEPGANRAVDITLVRAHRRMLSTSTAFVVDGYCFLSEPRRSAALEALAIARASAVLTVFDVVPHDAQRYFSRADVSSWLTNVDILICEVRTIRRVMGLAAPDEGVNHELALETWAIVADAFPGLSAMLRFGIGNIDETIHCRPGSRPEYRRTGYAATANPRGFGDRLTAAEVAEYVARQHVRT